MNIDSEGAIYLFFSENPCNLFSIFSKRSDFSRVRRNLRVVFLRCYKEITVLVSDSQEKILDSIPNWYASLAGNISIKLFQMLHLATGAQLKKKSISEERLKFCVKAYEYYPFRQASQQRTNLYAGIDNLCIKYQ